MAASLGRYEIVYMKLMGMKQKDIARELGMKEVAVSEVLTDVFSKIRERLNNF